MSITREQIREIIFKMNGNAEERKEAYKIMDNLDNKDIQLIVCYLVGLSSNAIKELKVMV
jgi:hypothetical protein